MAERPLKKQNWYERFVESYGPNFRIEINNPTMGYGGPDVYRMYGITHKEGCGASIGLDEAGLLKINSDRSIEIVAGERNEADGIDIVIQSRKGNVEIDSDGASIRISGKHIILSSDGDLTLDAKGDLNLNGNHINLNPKVGADIQGLSGNLVPPEKQLLMRVFRGITIGGVGVDVLMTALGLFRK